MDIYGLYSYGQTWTSSTIQNNRTSMVYGYSHGSPEIVKQQAEKKKKQKKKKESNIFFDFLDDIGDAIVETGKKAVDTVVDVGKYVGEKVVEYAPTVGTFIVENAPVLSNIKSGADFLFGVDVLTGERLSSTDRTLAFFGTFTGGGVKNLAESGFKNGSKFLNNLTPTVTRNVNKGTGYDGVRIINKKYAGQTYNLSGDLAKKYTNGVKFTNDGFPDFSPYSKAKVKIDGLKGNTSSDFTAANKAMGLKSTPSGYTWHHVEDGRTLMLVPTDLHQAVRHTGGAALIRKGLAP